jgi:hypothetical protein
MYNAIVFYKNGKSANIPNVKSVYLDSQIGKPLYLELPCSMPLGFSASRSVNLGDCVFVTSDGSEVRKSVRQIKSITVAKA